MPADYNCYYYQVFAEFPQACCFTETDIELAAGPEIETKRVTTETFPLPLHRSELDTLDEELLRHREDHHQFYCDL